MDLSIKWLKDYVDVSGISNREFAEAMTMSGSKVEGYTCEGDNILNVVTGKVISLEKHPDADKLLVCQIDVGDGENLQIVTGAQNLAVGDIIPVAKDGSTLPAAKIKKGKLRGVESFGMLCSLSELNLTGNDFPHAVTDGIFVLNDECNLTLGMDIRESAGLDDTVVEFEITSNRPDCLSIIGLAREASATFGKPLKLKRPKFNGIDGDASEHLKVSINDSLCSRYCAAVVKNVRIKPSPLWMRQRLRSCGVRPINNIVDITNYVMLEYGHPMHAFDSRFIDGNEINVRKALKNETIKTLDGIDRKLDENMLVIADKQKAVAVAGVMGGEFSCIMDDTRDIIFESACFDGASVRTTAKRLALRTDSSARFEKGLPNDTCPVALERALELVELLDAGDVLKGTIDCCPNKSEPITLELDADYTNRFLGTDIKKEQMVFILESLGFAVASNTVTVPYFRTDVLHKADLCEEIARIYGYNNIPSTVMRSSGRGRLSQRQMFEKSAEQNLLALGLSEIMTYSFISPKYYDKIRLDPDSPLRASLQISNPLGEDTSIMRTTAIPSMLEILAKNYSFRNMSANLYEIATEYIPNGENELPAEQDKIVVGMYGNDCDFYTIKGVIEEFCRKINIKELRFEAVNDNKTFHPGRCASIFINDEQAGIIGEIHPQVLENYDLELRTYVASIDIDILYNQSLCEKSYTPLPKFPAITRDLALICDANTPVGELTQIIKTSGGKLLEDVSLFDIYKGKQIAEDKKSVAFNLSFRSHDETLTVERADSAVKKILKALDTVGAVLRA